MIAISLKLEDRQAKLLDKISHATKIPKSALVRKGIELVLQQTKEDVLSSDFSREVNSLISEDKTPLKRLCKA